MNHYIAGGNKIEEIPGTGIDVYFASVERSCSGFGEAGVDFTYGWQADYI
jgi:hypothetical protein